MKGHCDEGKRKENVAGERVLKEGEEREGIWFMKRREWGREEKEKKEKRKDNNGRSEWRRN